MVFLIKIQLKNTKKMLHLPESCTSAKTVNKFLVFCVSTGVLCSSTLTTHVHMYKF